jgi:hypothetical protein
MTCAALVAPAAQMALRESYAQMQVPGPKFHLRDRCNRFGRFCPHTDVSTPKILSFSRGTGTRVPGSRACRRSKSHPSTKHCHVTVGHPFGHRGHYEGVEARTATRLPRADALIGQSAQECLARREMAWTTLASDCPKRFMTGDEQ